MLSSLLLLLSSNHFISGDAYCYWVEWPMAIWRCRSIGKSKRTHNKCGSSELFVLQLFQKWNNNNQMRGGHIHRQQLKCVLYTNILRHIPKRNEKYSICARVKIFILKQSLLLQSSFLHKEDISFIRLALSTARIYGKLRCKANVNFESEPRQLILVTRQWPFELLRALHWNVHKSYWETSLRQYVIWNFILLSMSVCVCVCAKELWTSRFVRL